MTIAPDVKQEYGIQMLVPRRGYSFALETRCACCESYQVNPLLADAVFAPLKRAAEAIGVKDVYTYATVTDDGRAARLTFWVRATPAACDALRAALGTGGLLVTPLMDGLEMAAPTIIDDIDTPPTGAWAEVVANLAALR